MPDHPLLDRAVRGRVWIALMGILLAGIVAMQVEVLKLGASIGRSIEQGSSLQSRNELLRASVSGLSDDQRIMRLAAAQGMVMPPPAGVGFLSAGAGHMQQALANIHQPNPTAFTTMTTTNGAVTTISSVNGTASGATATGTTAPGTTPLATGTGTAPAATTPTAAPTAAPTASLPTSSSGTTASGSSSYGATGSTPAASPTPPTPAPATPVTPTATPVTGPAPPVAAPTGATSVGPTSGGAGVPTG
jgi:hypothetical protein